MDKRLGVKFFGILNVLIGLGILVNFFSIFFWVVILGWVTEEGFSSILDWFSTVVIYRLGWELLYVFSFCLFWSGISMLRRKSYSRKLAIISSSAMCSGGLIWMIPSLMYYKGSIDFNSPWNLIFILLLIYTFILVIYLMGSRIKSQFNDQNVKLPFRKLILIILILFLLPLIFRLPSWLLNLFAK